VLVQSPDVVNIVFWMAGFLSSIIFLHREYTFCLEAQLAFHYLEVRGVN